MATVYLDHVHTENWFLTLCDFCVCLCLQFVMLGYLVRCVLNVVLSVDLFPLALYLSLVNFVYRVML